VKPVGDKNQYICRSSVVINGRVCKIPGAEQRDFGAQYELFNEKASDFSGDDVMIRGASETL
jgi:hypothetical protein